MRDDQADFELLLQKLPYLETLRERGGEAYLVGGTIRDFLLDRPIRDFDLVVNISPQEFINKIKNKIKGRVVVLDEKLGELRFVLENHAWFDISQLKGNSIEDDLVTRDYTINAMALPLSPTPILIDPLKGLSDLKKKTLRAIKKSNLETDPLRILRAFRFFTTLNFTIEKNTLFWLKDLKNEIKKSSGERIHDELFSMLEGKNIGKVFKLLAKTELLFSIFPELTPLTTTVQRYYQEQNLFQHTLRGIQHLENIFNNLLVSPFAPYKEYYEDFFLQRGRSLLFLGILFHDIGKPHTLILDSEGRTHFYGHDRLGARMVETFATRLRFSNEERDDLKNLVYYHMYPHFLAREEQVTGKALMRYARKTEHLAFPLILMAASDALATYRGGKAEQYYVLAHKLFAFLKAQEIAKPPKLITGYDLIEFGLTPSPVFKHILETVEEERADGKIKTREEAIALVKKLVS